jgi:triacylglycerol lipase
MPLFNFNATDETYNPQNAFMLAKFAQMAYTRDFDTIRNELVEKLGFVPDRFVPLAGRSGFPPIDTQGFVIGNQDALIVAFRGTEVHEPLDWLTDAKFLPVGGPGGFGLIHQGFAFALDVIFQDLLAAIERLRDNGQTLWFTGHSLGGALALLAAWRVKVESQDKHWAQGVYTFGQPRVGDAAFVTAFDGLLQSRTFRFVNHNDIVPRLLLFTFDHCGKLFYFDETGRLNSQSTTLQRWRDRLEAVVGDLRTRQIDGFDDHHMEFYLRNLENNLDQDPL